MDRRASARRATGPIWACPPAPRHAPLRSDSIYSRQSEEPKTGCQREPTAPLALSSSERRDPAHFARLRPLRRPEPAEAASGFSSNRKTIDIPPVRRYCSGQKKRWFKIPIQLEASRAQASLQRVLKSDKASGESERLWGGAKMSRIGLRVDRIGGQALEPPVTTVKRGFREFASPSSL